MRTKKVQVWKPTAAAAAELGISVQHLLSLRKREVFKIGIHWRDISGPLCLRSSYVWNVAECSKYFETPPEKR